MSRPALDRMAAAVLTGHGDLDMLEYQTDVSVPRPRRGEVLIQVAASGVNNTDINTRIGWYSKSVSSGTSAAAEAAAPDLTTSDATWAGQPLTFPRIQGADACGRIVAVGEGVAPGRIGDRVLVQAVLRTYVDFRPYECWTLGSECDGAFAQFMVAPDRETHRVRCDWSDAELAAVPCAYSTAENMLHRAGVGKGDRVLVTGASGGVGLAAVQLAKRRGTHVIGVCSPAKGRQIMAQGADETVDRGADLVEALGPRSVDAVVDIVGGTQMAGLLKVLRTGGACAIAGAIDNPVAQIDLRTLYLNDLRLLGCTFQDDEVFENLVGYIERNEFRPVVAKTYPLSEITSAQRDFLTKEHVGKLVLIPPPVAAASD